MKVYNPSGGIRGVFHPGCVALIRDNKMVCKPLIHGSLLMRNDLCAECRFSERVSACKGVLERRSFSMFGRYFRNVIVVIN